MNHIGLLINSAGAVLSHDIFCIRIGEYNYPGGDSFVFEITRQLLFQESSLLNVLCT